MPGPRSDDNVDVPAPPIFALDVARVAALSTGTDFATALTAAAALPVADTAAVAAAAPAAGTAAVVHCAGNAVAGVGFRFGVEQRLCALLLPPGLWPKGWRQWVQSALARCAGGGGAAVPYVADKHLLLLLKLAVPKPRGCTCGQAAGRAAAVAVAAHCTPLLVVCSPGGWWALQPGYLSACG